MCEQFLASDRILEELELELLTVPESKGAVETAEPESAEELAVEDDEEPPSSFAHPISARMMKLKSDIRQVFFLIATPIITVMNKILLSNSWRNLAPSAYC